MEILDRIHRIELGETGVTEGGPSVSAFYVQGNDSGLFIDAGFPDLARTQPILDYWRGPLGSFPTSWVLVSHRHYEHAGGVKILKDATGTRLASFGSKASYREAGLWRLSAPPGPSLLQGRRRQPAHLMGEVGRRPVGASSASG